MTVAPLPSTFVTTMLLLRVNKSFVPSGEKSGLSSSLAWSLLTFVSFVPSAFIT